MTIDEELNLLDQQLRRLKIEYEVYFNNPKKRPPTDVEWKVLSLLRKFSDGARISFSQRFRYNEMAQRYAVQSDLWRKKSRIREEGYRRPQDALLGIQGVRDFDDKAAVAAPEANSAAYEVAETGDQSLEEAASEALSAQAAPWPGAPQAAVTPPPEPELAPIPQPVAKTTAAKPAVAKTAAAKAAVASAPARKAPYSTQLRDVEKDTKSVESLYHALVEAKKNAGEKLGDAANFDSFSSFVRKKTDQIRKQYACETVEYSVELEAGKVKLKAKAAQKG